MTQSPSNSLIVKLCAVMEAVDHVEKKGHTSSPGGTYDFARDVDVSNALRAELSSRKIFLSSSITNVSVEVYETKNGGRGSISTVYTAHKFIDGETGETLDFTWASQGMDGQDKGVSKGATSAIKYALLKQFLIPTGEDPDENKMSPKDLPVQRAIAGRIPLPPRQPQPPAMPLERPTAPVATGAAPYKDQTPETFTKEGRGWFFAKLREMGLDHEQAAALLNIKSFKEEMGGSTAESILGWVAKAQLEQRKAAMGHERS